MAEIYMDVDTAVIVPVNVLPLLDDTDFKSIETAVVYNSAGLVVTWNFVTSTGVQTGVAITPTIGGVYDWSEPIADKGMYAIEIPASGGVSANNDTEGYGWISGVATGVLPWRGPIIGFRAAALNDALCDGGDNLDVNTVQWLGTACATPTVAGVPEVDLTHVAGATTNVSVLATNVDAILTDTGTDGVALSAAAVDNIWDEVLTGATHNIVNSAGRRLRILASFTLFDGTASAGTADSITLAGGSATDNIYTGCLVGISGGTGDGQSRYIVHYNGTTKIAKVARNWTITPDATSTFVIFADGQTEFIKMGLAQAGGAKTITLDTEASATNGLYNGQYIRILAGTGDDQLRTIIDYDGGTKIATIDKDWVINPDNTSVFATLPDGHSGREEFIEKWINNKFVESPTGTWTLYDDDNVSPLKTWAWNGGTATRSKAT